MWPISHFLISAIALAQLPPGNAFKDVATIPGVRVELRYASENNFLKRKIYTTLHRAYLEKDAFEKLEKAAQYLQAEKKGWSLLVFDALRPLSVQKILFAKVAGTEMQPYVANPKKGSIHNFGYAVDLSLLDAEGKEVDMGTPFDDFTALAQVTLEEKHFAQGKLTAAQLENRKLLRKIMEKAGFQQLPLEWWHYDALPANEVRKKHKIVD